MHLPQTAIFKKGDLIKFNDTGEDLFVHLGAHVGLISSDPIVMFEYNFEHAQEYIAYDIIVDGQLFKQIPEDFLYRIIQDDEKDIE